MNMDWKDLGEAMVMVLTGTMILMLPFLIACLTHRLWGHR